MPNGRVTVVDKETHPPVVVTYYDTPEGAEGFLLYLWEHGGTVTRAKVDRGGYGIEVPEDMK